VIFLLLPEYFLTELFSKNDIVSVVSLYVNLKRSGRNLVSLCPFHNEKTASMFVYPESNSFYCFGCGVGGSAITFIEKIENLSYIDAIKFLAQKAGISFPGDSSTISLLKQREIIFSINRESAKFYYDLLYSKEGIKALEYMKKRGILDNTIRYFGIGYSSSYYSISKFLLNKGYEEEDIVKSGLAFYGRKGVLVDRFFNRVMFPIINISGNVIAFGARALGDQKPKYINTSETPIFKKGSNLFSINFAKKSKKDFFILAEGYMDVVAISQIGFDNVVASLGTSITSAQARLISKYIKEVVIAYDSDRAGQNATEKAILILRQAGMFVRVLKISRGKDPDEFIRLCGNQASYQFSELIKKAENDIEYRLQKIGSMFDEAKLEHRLMYLREAIKILCEIDDVMEQEIWAGKLSHEMKIEKETVMSQIKKEHRRKQRIHERGEGLIAKKIALAKDDKINPEKSKFLRAASAEEALISYLIYHPEEVSIISREIDPKDFCTTFNRRVFRSILHILARGIKEVNIDEFSKEFSHEEMSRIVKLFIKDSFKKENFSSARCYIRVIIEEKKRNTIGNDSNSLDVDSIKEYMKMLKCSKK
jgi:DNA primase